MKLGLKEIIVAIYLYSFLIFFGSLFAQDSSEYSVPLMPVQIEAPEQPLPFSHQFHSSIGLNCNSCHIGSDEGRSMTLPSTEICAACHSAIGADKPSIQRLMNYHELDQDIPWVRLYRIDSGITWSHQTHVQSGLSCQTCHGPVEQREALFMETAVVAMATCIGCHQSKEINADCYTCHAWPSPDVIDYDYRRYLPQ
jgi:hypothetical protein